MLRYMSAKEAAEEWNISQRRVATLCSEERIEGAMMVGNMWIIPSNASKPIDMRTAENHARIERSAKPFIKWVGGKSQLLHDIDTLLQKKELGGIRKYAEPMVGGGALLFHMLANYSFDEVYISDINGELINCYNVVRDSVDQLIFMLDKMQTLFLPMNDAERKYFYYNVREQFNNTVLDESTSVLKAALFIFLNKTCFNGLYRVNKKGQFNVPIGAYKRPTICDEVNLRNVSRALDHVVIRCGDFTDAMLFIDEKTLVYIDPPYRPISKTSSFTAYNENDFDDDEQRRLAQFVRALDSKGANIILSNSDPHNADEDDKFFEELYNGFHINKVEATRMINSKGTGRNKISELLICN